MRIAALLAVALALGPAMHWVPTPTSLAAQCRATARTVGYPVPCPIRVPADLVRGEPNEGTGCGEDLVAAAGYGACLRAWRGWVLGTGGVTAGGAHFVVTAAPKALTSYTHLVNGPSWYGPTAYVRPLGWLVIHRWRMRAVFVPGAQNEGSAFMNHVALIWTTGGHTYGIGALVPSGLSRPADSLRLARSFARQIVLVRP